MATRSFVIVFGVVLLAQQIAVKGWTQYQDFEDQVTQKIPTSNRKMTQPPNRSSSRTTPKSNMKFGNRMDTQSVYPRSNAESCEFGFCENVNDYPKDKIKNILYNNKTLKEYFKVSDYEPPIIVPTRFNVEDILLCKTKSTKMYPEKAKNKDNVERYIVNVDGHKQGVVYETCLNATSKCDFSDMLPVKYTSHCVQRFQHKPLMVLEGEKFVFDLFELPSCCVCVLRK